MDVLAKLNDQRNLSLPERCNLASSLLNSSSKDSLLFPRKNQYLFDWLAGSLTRLSKTGLPKPEIFLHKDVWELLGSFADILLADTSSTRTTVSTKRPFTMITNDEEFFDCKKCFDSQSFVIKHHILSIFQASLLLLNESNDPFMNHVNCVDPEMISSVILKFIQQNRVSLPVSFLVVTEFVRSLVKCQSSLPSTSFLSLLRSTLGILSEIVVGGAANYKKTYPSLVEFCLKSACQDGEGIWIDFIGKCLFPQIYIDELLTFLTSPAMTTILKDPSVNESTLPKTLTFQKVLFVELAKEPSAFEACPVIYESFLKASGSKINREAGFNFFTFLLRKTISPSDSTSPKKFTQTAKLISILQERGNEIYQQRNDQIYRDQSAVIEGIFNSALNGKSDEIPFTLFLSLAKLNYYLVAERLDSIFASLNANENLSDDLIEFIVGMFQLAALANQLPVLLEIILKSKVSINIIKDQKLQVALVKIFQRSLSPVSLHQIYLSLSGNIETSDLCIVLLRPVIRSIVKIVDNVDSFDKEGYLNLQRRLFDKGGEAAFALLTEIVRWSPGTFLLMEDLFNLRPNVKIGYFNSLNLVCTLKCKDPKRISLKSQVIPDDYELLILKYLPVLAEDLSDKQLESFSAWLLRQDQLCLDTLKMIKFYEIREIQEPFLNQLVIYINENIRDKSLFILELISLLPWEYVNDVMAEKLIKSLWTLPSAVSSLLKKSQGVRKGTLKSLATSCTDDFVDYLFKCDEDDLVSKCVKAEHSKNLIKNIITRLTNDVQSVEFLSKMLKYSDFESEELIEFIVNTVDPISLIKDVSRITVKLLDSLDIIMEWIVDYKMELVASFVLALPKGEEGLNLEVLVRVQALRCKFPARTDLEFINESVEMASKLEDSSAVSVTFKKDLLSLVKEIPTDRVKIFLESLLLIDVEDSWKFALGLQASTQLLHITTHVKTAFNLFTENLNSIYETSLKFKLIPQFLAVIKSIVQLKKNVTWECRGISDILGVLRRSRQARPESFDEIFVTLRLIITLHLRQFRSLLPLLVSNICESFSGLKSVEESTALGRIISELGSLKRGELEPFALLPILHTFISTKHLGSNVRKPVQMAMNNLMYHLGPKKQLLQLLSTALVVEHEHRLILKSFLDEYNKFHKYSGRA